MAETFTVSWGRVIGDGNFGSERLEVSLSMVAQEGEAVEEWLTDGTGENLVEKCREFVLSQLSHSEAPRVAAVGSAELTGKLGREWAMSNAASEEHAIPLDDDQEALPF